jgi:hypothetical protein
VQLRFPEEKCKNRTRRAKARRSHSQKVRLENSAKTNVYKLNAAVCSNELRNCLMSIFLRAQYS